MADSDVPSLTELATVPDPADSLYIVDGDVLDKHITVANLLGGTILPITDDTYNIGSNAARHQTVFGKFGNFIDATGTPTITLGSAGYFTAARLDDSDGGTVQLKVGSATNFGVALGEVIGGGVGNTAFIENQQIGSLVVGAVDLNSSVTHGSCTIESDGDGCLAVGNISTGFASLAGQSAKVQAGNAAVDGCLAVGSINPGFGGSSIIQARGLGSVVLGAINSLSFGGTLQAEAPGSMARGYIANQGGKIECQSTAQGSLAGGVLSGTGAGGISSVGRGCFALGNVTNTATGITAGAIGKHGAFAGGNTTSGAISATGGGSFCWGNTTTATVISASADNSVQFGPGTNAEADSLQVGVAGTGIAIKGTTGAFGTPANGQVWNTGATGVKVRSNGVDIVLLQSAAYTLTATQGPSRTLNNPGAASIANNNAVLSALITDLKATGLIL